jgi:hypothetical protein
MGFIRDNLSTLDVVQGVLEYLPPSRMEVEASDALADAAGLKREHVLHELFLLKASIAAEYAQGMLSTLGMKEEGLEQFLQIYTVRLAEGLAASFPSDAQKAVGLLANRLKTYNAALHGPHPSDPHLGVADAFTRFCGAADEPGLVTLCLDTCKALNRRFLKELSDYGLKIQE